MSTRFYSLSHPGLVRSGNQDHILSDDSLGLWAVADGMGGHRKGDLASRLACAVLRRSIKNGLSLTAAFEQTHAEMRAAQQRDPSAKDMGTTLVAVLESVQGFELNWVGDSRAYLYSQGSKVSVSGYARRREQRTGGSLKRLTTDQNVASRLFERGEISAEQMRRHPHRHVLTDCIGQREGFPRIESRSFKWKPGQRLLLCSDGLYGEVSEAALEEIMASGETLASICRSLVERALSAGGGDNIAVVVVDSPLT